MYICIYRACERSTCVCVKSSLTYVYERSVYVNKTRSLCLYKYICTYRERMRVCAAATFSQSLCLSLSEKHTYTHTQPPPIYFIQIFISSYTHTCVFCCLPPLWGGEGRGAPTQTPRGLCACGAGGGSLRVGAARAHGHTDVRESVALPGLSHTPTHPRTFALGQYLKNTYLCVYRYACTYVSFKITYSYYNK